MPTLINDPQLEEELIADRQARGIDRFDEVWEEVYVMAPIANNEHQNIQTRLAVVLGLLIDFTGRGRVQAGANISDRNSDWIQNYRVPDVLVFLDGNPAQDRDTHWFGGPDFAVEIVSPNDRSREKLDFYASVGVRELLIVDRAPWQLELFRLSNGKLISSGIATDTNAIVLQSHVVPVSFQLVAAQPRPGILVTSRDSQAWTV